MPCQKLRWLFQQLQRQEEKMLIYLIQHGQIDPSDEGLLAAGNPHLDKSWIKPDMFEAIQPLRGIKFDAIYSGELYRIRETAENVCGELNISQPELNKVLDAVTCFHDGVLYPAGTDDPYMQYMDELRTYFRKLLAEHGPEATVLLVTSGARMKAAFYLAQGLVPATDKEIDDASSFPNGGIYAFEFDGNYFKELSV